jgi:hypothetical protein
VSSSWSGRRRPPSRLVRGVQRLPVETAGFVPGPDSLIARCLAQTGFTDEEIPTQVKHHYVVRAEDDSGNGAGPARPATRSRTWSSVGRGHRLFALLLASDFDTDDGGLVGTRDWEWASYAFTSAT